MTARARARDVGGASRHPGRRRKANELAMCLATHVENNRKATMQTIETSFANAARARARDAGARKRDTPDVDVN